LTGPKLHRDSRGKIQRPVAFCPILTDGLALSNKPILAGWEDMSKEKLDRAIPNCIIEFLQIPINPMFLPQIDIPHLFLSLVQATVTA
jgi:hypothetical protein